MYSEFRKDSPMALTQARTKAASYPVCNQCPTQLHATVLPPRRAADLRLANGQAEKTQSFQVAVAGLCCVMDPWVLCFQTMVVLPVLSMFLLRFDDVTMAYGDQPLLENTSFQVDAGERLCLLGRNGTGKSTLLRLAAGQMAPDAGIVRKGADTTLAMLDQNLPSPAGLRVYDLVASGMAGTGKLVSEWYSLANQLSGSTSAPADMQRLERVQQELESRNGWVLHNRIEKLIARLGLEANARVDTLSGGWRRRAELARALVSEPDLLLLDEPTNHLDLIAIEWLEKELKAFRGALLFITHDRAFARALSTRILHLDRGQLNNWACDYDTFIRRSHQALEAEQEQHARFDKKLAQEEAWIRKGIKARRTRNEGRVRALQALRATRQARREHQGQTRMQLAVSDIKAGKRVLETIGIRHGHDNNILIDGLDFTLMRGDKVGLIGANGAGKSTLLDILLGRISPQSGQVIRGTGLQTVFFDQLRASLDTEARVMDVVAQGRERICTGGRDRHVISYLEDFLFPPERARVPVKVLSGGERNRLLLAQLFSKPANLLVLDEPTNDLDAETLELLESTLVTFPGTVLLVSHDRDFLDNVVGSVLVFEGNGQVREYIGGFKDWLRQGGDLTKLTSSDNQASFAEQTAPPSQTTPQRRAHSRTAKSTSGLTYAQRKELAALPEEIDRLEQELSRLQQEAAAPDFYKRDSTAVQSALAKLTAVNQELEQKIERWSHLEERN